MKYPNGFDKNWKNFLSIGFGLLLSFPLLTLAMGSKKSAECSPEAANRTYIYEEEIDACAPEWVQERFDRRKVINDPDKEVPPWLTDLADRFGIVANGIRIAKSKLEIDRWVGYDPWTLREDTKAALDMIGARAGIDLNNFFSNNSGKLYSNMEAGSFAVTGDDFNPSTGSSQHNSAPAITFELPEDLTKQIPNAVILAPFKESLTQEQMIDLGVFILSKAPFFPKKTDPDAWDKWNKIKHDLFYYDVYLAVAVAAAAAMTNQGQLSLGGYLFKVPSLAGDEFRVGWIGKVRHLGIKGKEQTEAGLKFESKNLEGTVTYYRDFSTKDQEFIKSTLTSRWFNHFVEGTGWNTSANINAQYELQDAANPHAEKSTIVGVGVTAHKNHLVDSHGPELTASAGVNYSTNNSLGAGGTVILTDTANALSVSANVSSNKVSQPDGSLDRDTRFTLLGIWHPSGGVETAAKWFKHDVEGLRSDLDNINRAKAEIEKAPNEDKREWYKFWLEGARTATRYHLQDYSEDKTNYIVLKRPDDPKVDDIEPEILKQLQEEISKSVYDDIKDEKARKEAKDNFKERWGRLHFRTGMN